MIYKEIEHDLFDCSKDYCLAHCISADCAMGKGIALEFKNRGVKNSLQKLYKNKLLDMFNETDGFTVSVKLEKEQIVYNLITKKRYFMKPTYDSLRKALIELSKSMQDNNHKKLAMPYIGCGLDSLCWNKVSKIIKEVFADTDIEILICSLPIEEK